MSNTNTTGFDIFQQSMNGIISISDGVLNIENGVMTGIKSIDTSSINSDFLELNEDLIVNGKVTIESIMDVKGDSTFYGNLFVSEDINIYKNLDISGELSVQGISIFNNNIFVTGDVDIGKNLDISGDVFIDSTLNVKNDSFLNGNIFIFKDLDVSGNAIIDSDLYVTGKIYNQDLAINTIDVENLKISDTIYTQNDILLGNDLGLAGKLISSDDIITATNMKCNHLQSKTIKCKTIDCDFINYKFQTPAFIITNYNVPIFKTVYDTYTIYTNFNFHDLIYQLNADIKLIIYPYFKIIFKDRGVELRTIDNNTSELLYELVRFYQRDITLIQVYFKGILLF
jgi:cytoskeletal protein CcmA (bactofilin family)